MVILFFFLALLYISYSLVGVVVYWLCYMKTILMCNFNKYPKVFTVLIPYALIYRYRSIKICPQSAKLHQVTTQCTATCKVNQKEEKLTHQMAPLPQVRGRRILKPQWPYRQQVERRPEQQCCPPLNNTYILEYHESTGLTRICTHK